MKTIGYSDTSCQPVEGAQERSVQAKSPSGGRDEKHTSFGECQEVRWGCETGLVAGVERHLSVTGQDRPFRGKMAYRGPRWPGLGPTLLPWPWTNGATPATGCGVQIEGHQGRRGHGDLVSILEMGLSTFVMW